MWRLNNPASRDGLILEHVGCFFIELSRMGVDDLEITRVLPAPRLRKIGP